MKTIYFILISLFVSTLIYSQSDSLKSRYALSFGISNNFTLNNFDSDIALKKVLDNLDEIRIFISPRISISNFENDYEYNEENSKNNSSSYSLGIGSDYLWGILKKEDIQMFGGSGILFSYGHNNEKRTTTYGDSVKNITETTRPSFGVGLRGILGVEWKVSKRIGIHSEYLLALLYSYSEAENEVSNNGIINQKVTQTIDGISLSTRVLFGISIYL